jgi:hypothetical protein
MDPGEMSLLTLMVDFLLALLWLALGIAALLWLAVVGGLLRGAVALIWPCGGRTGRLSAPDTRFLRGMHIRP